MIKSIRDIQTIEPIETTEKPYQIVENARPAFGQRLMRNCALTALLLITVASVRNEKMPSGQTFLSAVQTLSGDGWDNTLGKISFVSALVPDTVAVFGSETETYSLLAPSGGELIHAWNAEEPYLSYRVHEGAVKALGSGQVMSVTGNANDGYTLRLRQEDGLEALYYDLKAVHVQEGDTVQAGTSVGQPSAEGEAILEIRKNGLPLDPTAWIETP